MVLDWEKERLRLTLALFFLVSFGSGLASSISSQSWTNWTALTRARSEIRFFSNLYSLILAYIEINTVKKYYKLERISNFLLFHFLEYLNSFLRPFGLQQLKPFRLSQGRCKVLFSLIHRWLLVPRYLVVLTW